tara:strand:- start:1928 stop:2464 length:537 start_codon:yes stop_codon:yes gene_type:complete
MSLVLMAHFLEHPHQLPPLLVGDEEREGDAAAPLQPQPLPRRDPLGQEMLVEEPVRDHPNGIPALVCARARTLVALARQRRDLREAVRGVWEPLNDQRVDVEVREQVGPHVQERELHGLPRREGVCEEGVDDVERPEAAALVALPGHELLPDHCRRVLVAEALEQVVIHCHERGDGDR